ncbi:MAG: DUF115 domain-containing protein [Treponema sp.]|nr:DUF115 domain-containing protein [Treponema sp.]
MSDVSNLHSRYNPVAEAERYLNALKVSGSVRFFILIEPGDGYIIPLLKQKFPSAALIALHISDSFMNRDGCSSWSPKEGMLQRFLERTIPDVEASAIFVLEWRPALRVFGDRYLKLLSETVDFIKRIDANTRTTKAFAKKWARNFFHTITLLKTVYYNIHTETPIIVVGAGPSLEESLKQIRNAQHYAFILAVSAAVPCLLNADIIPDFIVSTDGGTWSLFHLYECVRTPQSIPCIVSMQAAIPSQCSMMPFILLNDGNVWQHIILEKLHIPFMSMLQRGTVSATAVDYALRMTCASVGIVGFDMAPKDIQNHARPYSLDRFEEETVSRFNPLYHKHFVRTHLLNAGNSLNIYASWFKQQVPHYPPRLYTIGHNNPVFNSLPLWAEHVHTKKLVYSVIHCEYTVQYIAKTVGEMLENPIIKETVASSLATDRSSLTLHDIIHALKPQ